MKGYLKNSSLIRPETSQAEGCYSILALEINIDIRMAKKHPNYIFMAFNTAKHQGRQPSMSWEIKK